MKKSIIILILISLIVSCSEEKDETTVAALKKEVPPFLPFTVIALNDNISFADVPKNVIIHPLQE